MGAVVEKIRKDDSLSGVLLHLWHCRPPGCHNYNSRPTHRRGETWSSPNLVLSVLPCRRHHHHNCGADNHQVWWPSWRRPPGVPKRSRDHHDDSCPSHHHHQMWWSPWRGTSLLDIWPLIRTKPFLITKRIKYNLQSL